MIFVLYDNNYNNKSFDILANIVYHNFSHLAEYPELKHTIHEIKATLYNKHRLIILCFNDNFSKILGYLVGYDLVLNDGRRVMYISYIFVSKFIRSKGLGSMLIDICQKEAKNRKCEGVLLTCNTEDPSIMSFYEKRGFSLDFNLRRYARYDVLYKII